MWIYTSTPIRLHGVVLNYLSTGTTLPLPTTEKIVQEMSDRIDRNRSFSYNLLHDCLLYQLVFGRVRECLVQQEVLYRNYFLPKRLKR
jgi:hypothetical protein